MSSRGFEPVIGIEIHVQLNTQSKIFSSDSTSFDGGDNENTSALSVGLPGALPVLNSRAVEFAVKTGLALGCDINRNSVFSRKNYFYPDLAKGYQISQFDQPICSNGEVSFSVAGVPKTIKIVRAHMEEDAGKSTHSGDYTLINYNRAGVPLLEIVSGPDLRSAAEAAEYARTIRQIVRYLEVCDGNLEEGSLRCDCNVSVRRPGAEFGARVEIKNINSFRFIEKAIEYEIERQIDVLERNERVIQETRLWDSDKNRTFSMRSKEDAEDYRYFPDPDILPLKISQELIDGILTTLPELPLSRMQRFMTDLTISEADAIVLTSEKSLADYFERTYQTSGNAKASSNWIQSELLRELNTANKGVEHSPVGSESLGQLISLIDKNVISGKMGKTVFQEMWSSGESPESIIQKKGLSQITDSAAIEKIIEEVLAAHSVAVEEYKTGKKKNLFGFFVGAVMKASKGQANPDLVNKILNEKLG